MSMRGVQLSTSGRWCTIVQGYPGVRILFELASNTPCYGLLENIDY